MHWLCTCWNLQFSLSTWYIEHNKSIQLFNFKINSNESIDMKTPYESIIDVGKIMYV